jgi:hypothetical protein
MKIEHIMFLVNMTLEKPPWGKPVREIDVYIQISTLPLIEESVPHLSNLFPAMDIVACWQILGEYGCTLIIKSGL